MSPETTSTKGFPPAFPHLLPANDHPIPAIPAPPRSAEQDAHPCLNRSNSSDDSITVRFGPAQIIRGPVTSRARKTVREETRSIPRKAFRS
jgi:hypothetical protein